MPVQSTSASIRSYTYPAARKVNTWSTSSSSEKLLDRMRCAKMSTLGTVSTPIALRLFLTSLSHIRRSLADLVVISFSTFQGIHLAMDRGKVRFTANHICISHVGWN